MSGSRAVIVRFMRSIHRSRESRAAAGTTFITGYLSAAIFLSISIHVTSVYAIRQGVTAAIHKTFRRIERTSPNKEPIRRMRNGHRRMRNGQETHADGDERIEN